VGDLKQAVEFYRKLGLVKLKPRPVTEFWRDKELKILKMRDSGNGILELVEGDWKPHIAVTVDKTMDEIWLDYAVKADVLIEYKKRADVEIVYLKDPFGNYVEVVCER
jgi:catechol-2,3-dioxygenase